MGTRGVVGVRGGLGSRGGGLLVGGRSEGGFGLRGKGKD